MGLRAGQIFTEDGLAFFDISDPNQKMWIPYDAIRSFMANDQVNRVADESASTSESTNRNSGSTDSSPSVVDLTLQPPNDRIIFSFVDGDFVFSQDCKPVSVEQNFIPTDDPELFIPMATLNTTNGSYTGRMATLNGERLVKRQLNTLGGET